MLEGRLSMSKKIKVIFAYLICMFIPKSSSDAINSCTDPEELDAIMLRKAGFNGRS